MRALLAVATLAVAASSTLAEIPSATGYYEGTLTYAAQYMKNVSYATMNLNAKSDFWFVVDPAGKITGQGDVDYDFQFGIDWGMSVKVGISRMKVLGASLDPQVTLPLDPATAHQSYYLTGEVSGSRDPASPKRLSLDFSWSDPRPPARLCPNWFCSLWVQQR